MTQSSLVFFTSDTGKSKAEQGGGSGVCTLEKQRTDDDDDDDDFDDYQSNTSRSLPGVSSCPVDPSRCRDTPYTSP